MPFLQTFNERYWTENCSLPGIVNFVKNELKITSQFRLIRNCADLQPTDLILPMDSIDLMITDSVPDPELVAHIRNQGMNPEAFDFCGDGRIACSRFGLINGRRARHTLY